MKNEPRTILVKIPVESWKPIEGTALQDSWKRIFVIDPGEFLILRRGQTLGNIAEACMALMEVDRNKTSFLEIHIDQPTNISTKNFSGQTFEATQGEIVIPPNLVVLEIMHQTGIHLFEVIWGKELLGYEMLGKIQGNIDDIAPWLGL